MGRQPWVIHNVLRTAAATSAALPAWQVAISLAAIFTAYLLIVALTILFACRMVRRGPDQPGEAHP